MITVFLNNPIQMFTIILLIFAVICSCSLFTNAIEHLGKKLKLGNNAIGSILAVIGTSLPETIVPIVAILSSLLFAQEFQMGKEIALGAIMGSPFMLITFALGLLGAKLLFLFLLKKRSTFCLNIDSASAARTCRYFIVAYLVMVLAGFLQDIRIKVICVIFLLSFYLFFIYRTIVKSKQNFIEQDVDELIFQKFFKIIGSPKYFVIIFQILFSLLILVLSIHCFVTTLEGISEQLNISPVILSLIIAPFATELPECFNSVIWLKNKKDDLAIGNILGGTIFQVTIPASIGILFTNWRFGEAIFINIICTLLAFFVLFYGTYKMKKINAFLLLTCGLFYVLFIGYLLIK